MKSSLAELFRGNCSFENEGRPDFKFELRNGGKNRLDLFKNEEFLVSGRAEEGFLGFVETQIRMTIGEYAVDRVFVHAGVVAWNGKAIVIPGLSGAGKTTLVREFVAAGAGYLSDEYAVFDIEGMVHPFHKPLSIREIAGSFVQVDYRVEDLGGKCFEGPLETGAVIHTVYRPDEVWDSKEISRGSGVLKLLEHTLSIRYAPKFSLQVLDKVAKNAVFFESDRGEAPETVGEILNVLNFNI